MHPVSILCRAQAGLDAPAVTIEVFLGPGLPGLSIVGLVETAVKESRDRVRAAIQNSGFDMPNKHIVVSLAPADLPKSSSRYDLAIAVGILCASKQLPLHEIDNCEFFGELSLSGKLRHVAGSLPVAMSAIGAKHRIIIPAACAQEAGRLSNPDVVTAKSLLDVAEFLCGERTLQQAICQKAKVASTPDLIDVRGQLLAKRALEIAAVGTHHLLVIGPPGTGKSKLAERLPGLLPPQSNHEALETAAVYSLSGMQPPSWKQRPFRAPHHTATAAALAGGSAVPHPGEISLAHHGVLFLDELPEFQRNTLEVLREPMENGRITISRARGTTVFPARFQLLAAMNPCHCGYLNDPDHDCRCTTDQARRYRQRISGPFLDRIDMCVYLHREAIIFNNETTGCESSATIRERVVNARKKSSQRDQTANAQLDAKALEQRCWPDQSGLNLLENAANKLKLSRRGCNRILRVARSIADLANKPQVKREHIAEALNLRQSLLS